MVVEANKIGKIGVYFFGGFFTRLQEGDASSLRRSVDLSHRRSSLLK
jgi:hypothetical protein